MRIHHSRVLVLLAGLSAACADAESAGPEPRAQQAEPVARAQDARTFTVDESRLPFEALADAPEADRFWGTLDGAGYRIEIPKEWNGVLVMYAHGYAGMVPTLGVTSPSIRRHLLEQGYAWAASSYSKNYYDVRVGVEDTNKLALAFPKLAAEHGRSVEVPKKYYIIGHSMGGHVAGAAVEREALETAASKVRYAGAVPMCGVMGDTELFDYFAAYQLAAQHLAGMPATSWPVADFATAVRDELRKALWEVYPSKTTPAGDKVKGIVMNLSGGARPLYDAAFASEGNQGSIWNSFGGDGTIAGILNKQGIDTRDIVYQLDADPALSPEEKALNEAVFRLTPDADANPLQPDGVRWIPKVNGEIDIPVVTLHTLGDLFVPLKMQQIYRERAIAKGNADWLVQRVIRSVGHCEFTYAEQVSAFEAMVKWERDGVKPEGDELLDPAVVSSPEYGCKFTDNSFNEDERAGRSRATPASRSVAAPCPAE